MATRAPDGANKRKRALQDPVINYVKMPQVLNSSALVEVLSMRVERACRLKNFSTPANLQCN